MLAYEDGSYTLSEFKDSKKRIEKEISDVENEIKKIKESETIQAQRDRIYKLCEDAYTILSDPSVEDKYKFEISHHLFEKIIYNHDNETLEIYYR